MAYANLLLDEADDGVATLTLNRPDRLNALSIDLLEELAAALDALVAGGRTRCLLLTGAGRAFSSGADLYDERTRSGDDRGAWLLSHFNPVTERLFALPFPLVTALPGAAAGAGCSFALAGDLVIAARSAYLLQAFVNIGLVPDAGATWILPRLVGRQRAAAMMMLGERIGAEQALDWGLVWRVVDDDALATEARALAARLAAGPTKVLALIRRGTDLGDAATLSETLALEAQHQNLAGYGADFREGLTAFREKRQPRFTGQ